MVAMLTAARTRHYTHMDDAAFGQHEGQPLGLRALNSITAAAVKCIQAAKLGCILYATAQRCGAFFLEFVVMLVGDLVCMVANRLVQLLIFCPALLSILTAALLLTRFSSSKSLPPTSRKSSPCVAKGMDAAPDWSRPLGPAAAASSSMLLSCVTQGWLWLPQDPIVYVVFQQHS